MRLTAPARHSGLSTAPIPTSSAGRYLAAETSNVTAVVRRIQGLNDIPHLQLSEGGQPGICASSWVKDGWCRGGLTYGKPQTQRP